MARWFNGDFYQNFKEKLISVLLKLLHKVEKEGIVGEQFDVTEDKKEILGYFDVVDKEIRKLNSAVYQELQEIDIRLEGISRAIF